MSDLTLERDGAQHFVAAGRDVLDELAAALRHLPADQAGLRIVGIESLRPLLAATGAIGAVAASALGPRARAVRAVLFDKTTTMNWSLAWHQDRTICVVERKEVPGFSPWTIKSGLHHVAPPFDLLVEMVTLRVHLDDVPATNAPLLIAPGSHRIGRIPVNDVANVVRACGTAICLAAAGDIWLYLTPILHASEAATQPARRRVLQVDYAARTLPGGLEWLGV